MNSECNSDMLEEGWYQLVFAWVDANSCGGQSCIVKLVSIYFYFDYFSKIFNLVFAFIFKKIWKF